MFKVDKRRPRMNPWGTPQERGAQEEEASLSTTENDLFDTNEKEQMG